MISQLTCLWKSAWFWLGLIAICIAMESIALYYQYGLDYGPCVLCIHIRIWIAALLLIAIFGLIFRKNYCLSKLLLGSATIASIGMFERSWKTLGVERGWIVEACSLESGLPNWFALDAWFPYLFEIWEACGYTPELILNITMAEGLVAISAVLSMLILTTLLLSFKK